MLDPITALGFAASILTFIDFSWHLVTGTYEVYQSADGTTIDNARIEKVINDLQSVSDDLYSDKLESSKHASALKELAEECSSLSKKLLKILKTLKQQGGNSLWKSFKGKWASMRKADEISSMVDRLRDYRSEILIRLSLIIG